MGKPVLNPNYLGIHGSLAFKRLDQPAMREFMKCLTKIHADNIHCLSLVNHLCYLWYDLLQSKAHCLSLIIHSLSCAAYPDIWHWSFWGWMIIKNNLCFKKAWRLQEPLMTLSAVPLININIKNPRCTSENFLKVHTSQNQLLDLLHCILHKISKLLRHSVK